ncbi:MAG: hypothetical protein ACRENI_04120 [Gemmatimonadaceae bacterium]
MHRTSASAGFVGGLVLGAMLWNQQLSRHRRGLFSGHVIRRWVALSYLSHRPSVETARLLHDYVRWETRPALRRRGEQLLRHMEHILE